MPESMYDMEGIRIAGKRRPGKEIQVEQPRDLARDSGQRRADIFILQNTLRILAERLSQPAEWTPAETRTCCYSSPERGGSLLRLR